MNIKKRLRLINSVSKAVIKDEVITGIVIDRDFDIPTSIYDELTAHSIVDIFEKLSDMTSTEFINKYITNDGFRAFMIYIHVVAPRRIHHVVINGIKNLALKNKAFLSLVSPIRLMIYTENDWNMEKRRLDSAEFGDWFDITLATLQTAMTYPELDFQCAPIYRTLPKSIQYNEKLHMNMIVRLGGICPLIEVVKLAYNVGYDTSYEKTLSCLQGGVPILYHEYDATMLREYLRCILESGYTGKLDNKVAEFIDLYKADENCDIKGLCDELWEIGNTLNQDNLKYHYQAIGRPAMNIDNVLNALSITLEPHHYDNKMNASGWMTDFKNLIAITGPYPNGLPVNLQLMFLHHNGRIETMFDDEFKLLPEASIIRMPDQFLRLMNELSINRLRFLLHNSPEFVKTIILSSDLTMDCCELIARALFVKPIDEELWKLVNLEYSDRIKTDYRVIVINKIMNIIPRDTLFQRVPESMMYIEPDMLFIARNTNPALMPYIPAHKIVSRLKSYIAHRQYVRPNLYCRGAYTTIATAIGDPQFVLMNMIVQGGKYGYICDLTLNPKTVPELIDRVVDLIEEKRNE